MRILFLGTPDFALPTLRALVRSKHEVLAVITQPDKEGNRRVLTPPPVKTEAEKLGLPVYQFASLRKEGVDLVKRLSPDMMVTAAFGQIISQELLDIPPFGTLNVHGSLLPKYRGASPIQSCLLNGDTKTGVTIMRTALKVDSGDILLKKELPILPSDTAGVLFDKIAELGAAALVEAVDLVEKGKAEFTPQDESQATFCKMIAKSDGEIRKTESAESAIRKVRAMNPWPVAFFFVEGERFKVFSAAQTAAKGAPGTFHSDQGFPCLNLADGAIRLTEIQLEGKKRTLGKDFLLGHSDLLNKEIE